MKTMFLALFLLSLPALATVTNPNLPPPMPSVGTKTPPLVIAPNEQKTNGDVTVCNGNPDGLHPLGAGSTGKARIKILPSPNGQSSGTETKTDNGFRGGIWWSTAGNKTFVIANGCFAVIDGPAGQVGCGQTTVTVGSGSTVIVRNTTPAATGAQSILVHSGSTVVTVYPGQIVPVTNN